MPQVLYRAGLFSKEGLQEHDSVDPILVVKFPRVLREPPSALPPGRYLRSTWILHEGQWHQVEDHAQMPDTLAKFDRFICACSTSAGRCVGGLCSTPFTTSWPALCACPACQMAVGGCRASAHHPWRVPGLHITSSFQQSTLFSSNSDGPQ